MKCDSHEKSFSLHQGDRRAAHERLAPGVVRPRRVRRLLQPEPQLRAQHARPQAAGDAGLRAAPHRDATHRGRRGGADAVHDAAVGHFAKAGAAAATLVLCVRVRALRGSRGVRRDDQRGAMRR